MPTEAFERCTARWLTSFQQDIKDFVHVVCDDQDLEDELREYAAGAVLYALAPGDVIPDSNGALGFVDDALALRIVLIEIEQKSPKRFAAYAARMPEVLDTLDADINASKTFLAETYEPFRERILAKERIEFQGKRVRDALEDPGWLEQEIAVLSVKLDFKPSDVQSASKKGASVLSMFRQKLLKK